MQKYMNTIGSPCQYIIVHLYERQYNDSNSYWKPYQYELMYKVFSMLFYVFLNIPIILQF